MATVHLVFDNDALGNWDEALSLLSGLPAPEEAPDERIWLTFIHATAIPILVRRGELEAAGQALTGLEGLGETSELQDQFFRNVVTATVRLGEGRHEEALLSAETAFGLRDRLGSLPSVSQAFACALQAAFELGRLDRVEELLSIAEAAPPRDRTPFVSASVARFRGRLAATKGDAAEADRQMAKAISLLRDINYVFWMAIAEIEHAEMLAASGRTDQAGPLAVSARETFERLNAKPWLERVDRALGGSADRSPVIAEALPVRSP